MVTATDVRQALADLADPRRAEGVRRYLRMVPGGYGEGDRAIGVSVPDQRRVAGRYWRHLSLAEATELLTSDVHEERLTSLFILVRKFDRGDEAERGRILERFLARHYRSMPRVMLRYAIEKFEPQRRREYLSGAA
ncbi:DNA alkylation repair protein [Plantactinospora sp. B5E13]|uniref:DNA alkylation repair protein n=1 Tax=unclassified Plantactinospora TaxID=2631981 RepID=UPI00325D2C7C